MSVACAWVGEVLLVTYSDVKAACGSLVMDWGGILVGRADVKGGCVSIFMMWV